MKIKILEKFDREAGKIVGEVISQAKIIALSTGKTPVGMYRELVKQKLDWRKVKVFLLDVNYLQNPAEADSFYSYINTNLLNQINLPPENFNILDSQTDNPESECLSYEEKIAQAGGLDLAVLGIGENGHIAYNEPGSSFQSITRKVRLVSGRFQYGLTMGIKTIMSARKIILLAKGENKAKAVRAAIKDRPEAANPASWLQNHQEVTYILDKEAAGLL